MAFPYRMVLFVFIVYWVFSYYKVKMIHQSPTITLLCKRSKNSIILYASMLTCATLLHLLYLKISSIYGVWSGIIGIAIDIAGVVVFVVYAIRGGGIVLMVPFIIARYGIVAAQDKIEYFYFPKNCR